MDEGDLKEIETMLKRQIAILHEDIHHKLEIVVEGYQLLNSKLDRLIEEQQKLIERMDAIAADLSAHRADTEIHRAR
jgi:putative methionine-R-sulfoxide reductase with GAF domain